MSLLRSWRQRIPARLSELLALVSVSTTFMLYIHTSHLQHQLQYYNTKVDGTGGGRPESSGRERKQSPYATYNLQDYRHLSAASLNVTKGDARQTLLFNRVPKVGSQSTMELLRVLSYKNGFTFHKDRPQKTESIQMSDREQRRLAKLVEVFRPPSVYVKHVCYINFTALNFTQPIYVNMVRDPVERAISWYYYVRAPWYFVERKQAFPDVHLPSTKWLRKDYETCVRTHDLECSYLEGSPRPDFAQLTEFFCGQHRNCTGFNTKYALNVAKENVEKYYAVVGVLEEMNMTLTVLEHYLPRFFKGAKDVYWKQVHRFSKINKNIYKPSVEEDVKNIVRGNFTREIEFYEFCRQRLYKQYAALNLVEPNL